MSKFTRKRSAALLIVIFAVVFAGFNGVFDRLVSNAQLDLTENGRFTLSDGTKQIVTQLKTPVTLRFFYSRKVAANYPQTRAYAARVHDLLQRYVAISHGKIRLQEIDPEPYSEAEDDATGAGLTPIPTDSGDNVYFGLVITAQNGGSEQIPYFSAAQEARLEYDITAKIDQLSHPARPKVAIISGLPLEGGAQRPPLAIYSQLNQSFDVTTLPADFKAIPKGTKVLMLVHPRGLSQAQLYAIDQYALKGGHIAAFVDPDSNLAADASGMNYYAKPAVSSSNLKVLFKAWGIGFDPKQEVADLALAQKVQTYQNGAPTVALYPAWLHVTGSEISADDPSVASLQELNLATVGALTPLKGATTKIVPLIRSSDKAGLVDTTLVHDSMDPGAISAAVRPDGTRYTLAARITGPAKSAFPAGLQPPKATADKEQPAPSKPSKSSAHPRTAGTIHVVVVADTDLFDDKFWVHRASAYSDDGAQVFADNGAFVLDIVENLTGSDALSELRSRKPAERPFTLVQQLQANAAVAYQQQAQTLQAELKETQTHLKALQAEAGKSGGKETEAKRQVEMAKFRQKLVETRTALRAVEHNLRKDIDLLGDVLAVINIAFIPALVIIFALVMGWQKRRRRRRAHHS